MSRHLALRSGNPALKPSTFTNQFASQNEGVKIGRASCRERV